MLFWSQSEFCSDVRKVWGTLLWDRLATTFFGMANSRNIKLEVIKECHNWYFPSCSVFYFHFNLVLFHCWLLSQHVYMTAWVPTNVQRQFYCHTGRCLYTHKEIDCNHQHSPIAIFDGAPLVAHGNLRKWRVTCTVSLISAGWQNKAKSNSKGQGNGKESFGFR